MNHFLNKLLGLIRKPLTPHPPAAEPGLMPRVQSAEPVEQTNYFPPTFGAPPTAEESIDNLIFDPSTRNFARAFRRGDPILPDAEMKRWHSARRRVMHHLLNLVVHSPWAEHLVLRGSLALKASLGPDAREPGDIDWVVQPAGIKMNSEKARQMMDGLIIEFASNARFEDIEIDVGAMTRNDIWTYERAAGHRLAFPWQCGALPSAVVQMDFVFEQELFTKPVVTNIQLGDLPEISVQTASNEEALAWKLLWLNTDTYPQGKDLYDAVLLAELTSLTSAVLQAVLWDANCTHFLKRFPLNDSNDLCEIDWENFLKECPWVQGTKESWIARLQIAIRETVAELRRDWNQI